MEFNENTFTHVDEATRVVQSAEMRTRQREVSVKARDKGLELVMGDGGSDDQVAKGMSNEADAMRVDSE